LKWLAVLLFFSFASSLWAMPKSFELWLLSSPTQKQGCLPPSVKEILAATQIRFSPAIALVEEKYRKEATKVGDQYFHPQIGLFDAEGEETVQVKEDKYKQIGTDKYISGEDNQLVECDKGYYFDLYCGKAKKEKEIAKEVSSELEVWIDTSSSLRAVDSSNDPARCGRRSFVEHLQKKCKKLNLSVFDTGKKEMGTLDMLCINYGLNDQDRLIQWIKDSEAKRLIIVTDISEYSVKLSDFVELNGGKIIGQNADLKPQDLLDKVPNLCSK